VQKFASRGYSVVREYVGHAIGTEMHEPPGPELLAGHAGPTLKEAWSSPSSRW